MFTESDAKSAFNTPLPPSLQRKEYKRYTSTSASSFQMYGDWFTLWSSDSSKRGPITKTISRMCIYISSFLFRII